MIPENFHIAVCSSYNIKLYATFPNRKPVFIHNTLSMVILPKTEYKQMDPLLVQLLLSGRVLGLSYGPVFLKCRLGPSWVPHLGRSGSRPGAVPGRGPLVSLKGDQSWVFIGRTDVEAETPVLWPPDGKSRFFGKDPDGGKD